MLYPSLINVNPGVAGDPPNMHAYHSVDAYIFSDLYVHCIIIWHRLPERGTIDR